MAKFSLKLILLTLLLLLDVVVYGATPNKPVVMVIPEEAFCINSGYYHTDGKGNKTPDYAKALQNDDVLDVINTFEILCAEYGFPLTNLQQTLNEIHEDKAFSLILTSKDDADIIEDDLDRMSRHAKADILIKVAPSVTPFGPQKQVKLRVSSIDCASKKTLQSFGPVVRASAGPTSAMLRAAVSDNIERFLSGLGKHFEEFETKGREGSLSIKISESCPLNFESEVLLDGQTGELADLIEWWLSENTVSGVYTGGKTSRYSMKFDQVRIPLQGKAAFGKEKSLTMEDFVKTGLTKLLAQYGISVATHPIGIGKAYLVLGAK